MQKIRDAFNMTLTEIDPLYNYQESVYQNAMAYFLGQLFPHNFVAKEVRVDYCLSDGYSVGWGRMDIVIETDSHAFIIELKRGFCNIGFARAQVRRYANHYRTDKHKVGILCIFSINPCFERVV